MVLSRILVKRLVVGMFRIRYCGCSYYTHVQVRARIESDTTQRVNTRTYTFKLIIVPAGYCGTSRRKGCSSLIRERRYQFCRSARIFSPLLCSARVLSFPEPRAPQSAPHHMGPTFCGGEGCVGCEFGGECGMSARGPRMPSKGFPHTSTACLFQRT